MKQLSITLLLITIVLIGFSLSAIQCKQPKQEYKGKCLYPNAIKKAKASAKKNRRKTRTQALQRNFSNRWIGLRWSKVANNTMNWSDAAKYCKKLGGRLPTKSELKRLYDDGSASSRRVFWSSSVLSNSDGVYHMGFYDGRMSHRDKDNELNVYCVRE